MPLYIKAPAISSNGGPDETWCQRSPCKTKPFQHTTLHKYKLVKTPKEPVPSSYPNPMPVRTPISITNTNRSQCVIYEYQHLLCKKKDSWSINYMILWCIHPLLGKTHNIHACNNKTTRLCKPFLGNRSVNMLTI